jgi:hypothetical protein
VAPERDGTTDLGAKKGINKKEEGRKKGEKRGKKLRIYDLSSHYLFPPLVLLGVLAL